MPASDVVEACEPIAKANGCTITLTAIPSCLHRCPRHLHPTCGSPAVSQSRSGIERIKQLEAYRVTQELMDLADPSAIFLHCLPSFHDTNTTIGADIAKKFGVTEMEVTDEVFEGPQSKVFDEAENRMHTIKAVMYATLK